MNLIKVQQCESNNQTDLTDLLIERIVIYIICIIMNRAVTMVRRPTDRVRRALVVVLHKVS